MINRVLIASLYGMVCLSCLISCRNNMEQEEKTVRPVVPVQVTSPRTGMMAEYAEMIATSAFLVRTVIKSPVTGYVQKCALSPGDKVVKDQLLFLLQTKEAAALQQDSLRSINIKGIVNMKSPMNGALVSIDHQQGDFVQEGDVLAVLIEPGSLVFLMDVPFEMSRLVGKGHVYKLILPDNTEVNATVRSVLPSMSGASQTQRVVLQPGSSREIPENLMAKIKIVRNFKTNAWILPKSCILNDEVMKNFWIMKMISDSVAVKVPVKPGIIGADSMEVVSPVLSIADRILISGNYGVEDTITVRILKPE
jgi:hypothetical protein